MSIGRVPTSPPSGGPSPFASFAGQQPYPQFVMNGAGLAAVAAAIKLAKPSGVDQIVISPSQRVGWSNAPGGKTGVLGNDNLNLVFNPIVWFPLTPSAPPPSPPNPFAAFNG